MSAHKLTPEHFEVFQAECLRLRRELGLIGWELFFHRVRLNYKLASVQITAAASIVAVSLANTWPAHYPPTDENLKAAALHEMLHVLLGRVSYWGTLRETDLEEMRSAEEAAVNSLTVLLTGKI